MHRSTTSLTSMPTGHESGIPTLKTREKPNQLAVTQFNEGSVKGTVNMRTPANCGLLHVQQVNLAVQRKALLLDGTGHKPAGTTGK